MIAATTRIAGSTEVPAVRSWGIDTIKVVYTYTIATILIVGGILFLYFSRNDPPGGNSAALVPMVTGFIGAAVQFVFNRETQATTAAQVAKATQAANDNAAAMSTPSILS